MSRIPLWIDLRHVPVNKRLPFLHAIDETASQCVVLAKDDPHHQRAGLKTVWMDGHNVLKQGKAAIGKWVKVTDAKAVEKASKVDGIVVVDAADWKIIPLENLIVARQDRPGTLYAVAQNVAQAQLFAQTMEHGVDGIVYAPISAQNVYDIDAALRKAYLPPQAGPANVQAAIRPTPPPTPQAAQAAPRIVKGTLVKEPALQTPELVAATVTGIEDGGLGDRVCIDVTSLLREGEGLLVGSTARSFVLVHAETLQSEFIATRPFRVNAGAVHSYLFGPDNKTRYLSELMSGQSVLAVHMDGTYRVLSIGRVKVERRPHLLVRWRCGDGTEGNAAVQNAETIRLVTPSGATVAVTDLALGAQIIVHNETAARHTGLPVAESIEER